MPNVIQAQIPERLWQQAQNLVAQGWASNMQELVNESLRRYLESHEDVLTRAEYPVTSALAQRTDGWRNAPGRWCSTSRQTAGGTCTWA